MPTRPQHVNEIISKYIKAKVPHFFIYAKDKDRKNVEDLNGSVVNKLEHIVPNKPIQFKKIAGELDYKILMGRGNVNLNSKLIKIYTKYDRNKKILMNRKDDLNSNDISYFYQMLKNELLSVNDDAEYVTDVLIKHLYENKNSKHKTTLWNTFGNIIVNNIKHNLKNTKQCEECGSRIENYNTKKYCEKCAKEKLKESKRNWKRKNGRINQVG